MKDYLNNLYTGGNLKKDDNYNNLSTRVNFKKFKDDKVAVDDNINKKHFVGHVMDHLLNDLSQIL